MSSEVSISDGADSDHYIEDYTAENYDSLSLEEKIQKAEETKAKGSSILSDTKNYKHAKKLYEVGLKYISNIPDEKRARIEDVKKAQNLKKALNLNAAMMCIKLEEWDCAITYCRAVLLHEPMNSKALYRKAVAQYERGYLDEAKIDIRCLITSEPENIEAKLLLKQITKKVPAENAKEANFANIFQKGAGMYNDREQEVTEKKKQEAEDEKTGKNKEKIKQEKEREKKQKAEYDKQSKPAKVEDDFNDDDLKVIAETKKMGYCYFNREKTEMEKKLVSAYKPQKIEDSSEISNEATGANSSPSSEKQRGVSSWNALGTTYEEKNVTSMATKNLSKFLKVICGSHDATGGEKHDNVSTYILEVSAVHDVNGEAHMAVIRGNKRCIFDLSCTMDYSIKICLPVESPVSLESLKESDDESHITYHLEYKLLDISSQHVEGSDWLCESRWRCLSKIVDAHLPSVQHAMAGLKMSIAKQLSAFLDSF